MNHLKKSLLKLGTELRTSQWNMFILLTFVFLLSIFFISIFNICFQREVKHSKLSVQHSKLSVQDNESPLDKETLNENFPYVKETAFTLPMQKFDRYYTYKIQERPKNDLTNEEQILFNSVINRVSSELSLSNSTFSYGNYRLLKNGMEYNLYFDSSKTRVSVFQPFSSLVIKKVDVPINKKIKLILPLKGRIPSLSVFLDNLVTRILPVDPNFSLTIVYFSDEHAKKAESLVKNQLRKYPNFEWSFVHLDEGKFSRGKGIKIGMEAVAKRPNDLVFVCDVDVLILPDFFYHCRSNALYRQQVYFPVVFSLYNPSLVYLLHDQTIPSVLNQLLITPDNGFWRYFGFGMFCMHKSEYDTVGGIPELNSWGGEDILFYERFGKYASIKVIRSLDSSIFHVFHHKNCTSVSSNVYPSCLMSKASTEGTQTQLALLLFKLHEGVDLEGILSKTFYYFWLFPILISGIGLCVLMILYQCWLLKKARK